MILKSPKSKLSIVNLLSDFILSKIPSIEESIIQIADCNNFYIIKGKTTYSTPLDINKIKDEFIEKFKSKIDTIKLTNTIDLIEYDYKLDKKEELSFTYHNTVNCSYHYQQIESYNNKNSLSYDYDFFLKNISDDDNLIFLSSFPHGYSLNQGRLLYYYGKNTYPVTSLTFNMSTKQNDGEQIFSVLNNFSNEFDEDLKSAILDMFDFDMIWLEKCIKKVDWSVEITNPLYEYDFLKKINKDFLFF